MIDAPRVSRGAARALAVPHDQAVEPPFAINDAGKYFLNRIGAAELAQLLYLLINPVHHRDSAVRGYIVTGRGRALC